MDKKKCAVIVVTHNGKKWYDKCFQSLVHSSIPVKIYVVDNASTDDSALYIASKFPQIQIIQNRENVGFAKANNIGLNIAYINNYDYFFLLNQDAWVERTTIETLIDTAQKEPDFGILSPIHLTADKASFDFRFQLFCLGSYADICKAYAHLYLKKQEPMVRETKNINAAAWLLTKRCIQIVGGFDTILFKHYGEDNNYCQRALYHKLKIGIVPSVTICHDRENRIDINKPMPRGVRYAVRYGDILTSDKTYFKNIFKQLIIDGQISQTIREFFWIISNCKKIKKSRSICMVPQKGFDYIKFSAI